MPETCSEPKLEVCPVIESESCECDEGYVLSGDKCVKRSECGCTEGSEYYPVSTWKMALASIVFNIICA